MASEQPAAGRSPLLHSLFSAIPFIVAVLLALLLYFYAGWAIRNTGSWLALPPFHFKVLSLIGISIVMAVSLNIVNGFTGQFSLGHAGFMAVGAYVSGAITYYGSILLFETTRVHGGFLGAGDWLFVLATLCGGGVAALFGYLVGLPSLRLRGDYLAIVTLGFGEIIRVLLIATLPVKTMAQVAEAPVYTLPVSLGGALGFNGIPKYTNLFWIYLFAFVAILVSYRLKESIHGREFLAIREDEVAADAMGVPTTRVKVAAFVLAAFFAGIGGSLFAHELGTLINPNELNFQKSIDYVIMVVLGGMGSISGSVLAAVVLTILPELLRNLSWIPGLPEALHDVSDYRLVLFAVLLIVMMHLRPQGLFGLREIWETRAWRWVAARLGMGRR